MVAVGSVSVGFISRRVFTMYGHFGVRCADGGTLPNALCGHQVWLLHLRQLTNSTFSFAHLRRDLAHASVDMSIRVLVVLLHLLLQFDLHGLDAFSYFRLVELVTFHNLLDIVLGLVSRSFLLDQITAKPTR